LGLNGNDWEKSEVLEVTWALVDRQKIRRRFRPQKTRENIAEAGKTGTELFLFFLVKNKIKSFR